MTTHAPLRAPGASALSSDLPLRWAGAALSVGAAAVHFSVMGPHFAEWWAYGAFFAVAAWLQVGWGIALIAGVRSRALIGLGAVGQIGIVVLWAVTRTTGLPFGPDILVPEQVGAADVASVVFEVLAGLVAVALLLSAVGSRRVGRGPATALVVALAVGVATATTLVLDPVVAGGEHAGAMDGMTSAASTTGTTAAAPGAMPMHSHTTAGAGAAGAGAVPAGWTSGCMHMSSATEAEGHGQGACTDAAVTPAQRDAAERLARATTAAVVPRFSSLPAAERAGYHPVNISGPLWHVANKAFQTDGRTLDPQRVESLVYYVPSATDHSSALLLGAMYTMDAYGQPGPLVGGALTSWHSHTNLCVSPTALTAFNPRGDGSCARGSFVAPTNQMLHVWTVPYDGGPFAELSTAAVTKAIMGALSTRH